MTLAAILLLAGGTFAFRVTGPLLHRRVQLGPRVTRLLSVAASVLLVALVATSALAQGHVFAGWARPAGVLVGGGLAVLKLPFPVVVIAAAATAAGLRLVGVR
jgi:branched-subunit amino acid transport protein